MTREKLKEVLSHPCDERQKLYRQYPTLHRDLAIWEDYLLLVEANHKQKYRAAMNGARYEICDRYEIGEKTFYKLKHELETLCEDM